MLKPGWPKAVNYTLETLLSVQCSGKIGRKMLRGANRFRGPVRQGRNAYFTLTVMTCAPLTT